MASLFRRKLVCFYCGCKSTQTRTPNLHRWQCTHCEADNYLDENGEITDPPAEDISSNARYGGSLTRPISSAFVAPDDTLFCQNCLRNQHLVSQALASYLPPTDAPDYAEYEKAEEEYLKGLEERYPQVCERCEPKVQEKIRAAGYAAKTDHLRRLMDRTRGHGIQYRDASWGSSLVPLGGVGWFLSLVGQILWDGLSLFESTEGHDGLRDPQTSSSASVCLQQVMRGSNSISNCTELLHSAAGLALLLGILSCWWNPMLHEISRRKGVRAVGIMEFYRLQILLLIIRCTAWWYFPSSDLSAQMTTAAHLSLFVLTAIINVTSFRTVQRDFSAPVQFQDSPEPLASRITQEKSTGTGTKGFDHVPHRSKSSITRNDGGKRPFSIMDLAPSNQQQSLAYQPPTPPPDDDDDEAMDWTPSQENKILRPATTYRAFKVTSQQPQPLSYRDKLTVAAQKQSTSLRIPPNQSMTRRSVGIQNREFAKTPTKFTMRDSYNESPFATPYEPSLANGSPDLSPIKFAQPKFFPHTDREELGLESLMAKSFSLAEEPHEVRARQRKENSTVTQSRFDDAYAQWHGSAALLLLTISCAIWTNTPIPSSTAFRTHFRLAALCIAALVILKSLLLVVRKDSSMSVSTVMLLTFELTTTIILGAALRHREATTLSEDSIGPLETPGIILIAALIMQEAWMLCCGTWVRQTSIGDVHSPPVSHLTTAPDKVDRQKSFAGSSSMPLSTQDPKTSAGMVANGQHRYTSPPRKTRAQTKAENDTHARGGFGSLSLNSMARSEQGLGLHSANLGHSQRRARNGMW